MTSGRVEIELPKARNAPGLARSAIQAHLAGGISEDDRRTLTLLASELVTNAIRHTGSARAPVRLIIDASGARIRVEVHDRGPGFEPGVPRPHAEGGGYGLVLVERMADRWGVRGRDGSQVWFELDRRAA